MCQWATKSNEVAYEPFVAEIALLEPCFELRPLKFEDSAGLLNLLRHSGKFVADGGLDGCVARIGW